MDFVAYVARRVLGLNTGINLSRSSSLEVDAI
jgi:hypothetical protein